MNATPRLSELIERLDQLGWRGSLAGPEFSAVRRVLTALTTMVDDTSGCGPVPVHELASRAGYGSSRTRWALRILENAWLIEWRRGGTPVGATSARVYPTWFRIDPADLAALVGVAESTGSDS